MTRRYQVYWCKVCGNMVEVTRVGRGELVCCDVPMILLAEQSQETLHEKHRPHVEERDGSLRVVVGAVPHPREDRHFIEWIEVVTESGVCRKYLRPGDLSRADFPGGYLSPDDQGPLHPARALECGLGRSCIPPFSLSPKVPLPMPANS